MELTITTVLTNKVIVGTIFVKTRLQTYRRNILLHNIHQSLIQLTPPKIESTEDIYD